MEKAIIRGISLNPKYEFESNKNKIESYCTKMKLDFDSTNIFTGSLSEVRSTMKKGDTLIMVGFKSIGIPFNNKIAYENLEYFLKNGVNLIILPWD